MSEHRKPLRVLFIDDSPDDADLLSDELRRAGFEVSSTRVHDEITLRGLLRSTDFELILCDWIMPTLSATRALQIVRELERDLPFIIVSGMVGEATVVDALRAGAHDFVTKLALTRLIPAVERELREAELRKARRASEAALEHARQDFRRL